VIQKYRGDIKGFRTAKTVVLNDRYYRFCIW